MKRSWMLIAVFLGCILTVGIFFVPLAQATSPADTATGSSQQLDGALSNVTDASSITQFAPILVGPLSPQTAAYDTSNKLVYVADADSPYFNNLEGVTAINSTNWATTFSACTGASNGPEYIVFDPANNDLYVSCIYPGDVTVINPKTESVITTVTVGSSPGVLAYDPASQDIYISNYGSNTISVISSLTNKVVATVNTGDGPMWITYSPANEDVYVIDSEAPYGITIINGATNTLLTTVSVDAGSAIYDPTSQEVYAAVTAYVSGVQTPYVYAISTSNQIVARIQVSGMSFPAAEFGGSLVYDISNGNLFVGSDPGTTGPNVVSEISSTSNRVLATVNIPADCTLSGCYDLSYLTYDSTNGDVYVSGPGQYIYIVSSSDQLVQAISLTIIASSSTTSFPVVSIFDPSNNEVFVLCDNYAELILPLSS